MWAVLGQFLIAVAVPMLFRLLSAVGVGWVSYNGIDALMNNLEGVVHSQFAGLPTAIVQIAALLKVDVFINIIFSAYAVRFALATTNGVLNKMFIKGPQ